VALGPDPVQPGGRAHPEELVAGYVDHPGDR
jgi:hypothetical protein